LVAASRRAGASWLLQPPPPLWLEPAGCKPGASTPSKLQLQATGALAFTDLAVTDLADTDLVITEAGLPSLPEPVADKVSDDPTC
jgi:hypothetical protein